MKNRIESFDGLRGIFAVLIFFNHCSFMKSFGKQSDWVFENVFHNGGFCVLFFFILSGFCTYIGYGKRFKQINRKNYFLFLQRRMKKIYFPYIISMVWVMIYRCVVLKENLGTNLIKLFLSLTMLQTLDVKHWDVLNSAAWFISCIWIIYLMTPFLLKKISEITNIKVLFKYIMLLYVGIIGIHLGVYFLTEHLTISLQMADLICYVWPFVRIFDFSIGMLWGGVYVLVKKKPFEHNTIVELICVILTLIAWTISLNTKTEINLSFMYTMPILSLLIFVFAFDSGKVTKILSKKTMQFMGKYSMEIYLFHYVIIWSGGWMLFERYIHNYSMTWLILMMIVLFCTTVGVSIWVDRLCDKWVKRR